MPSSASGVSASVPSWSPAEISDAMTSSVSGLTLGADDLLNDRALPALIALVAPACSFRIIAEQSLAQGVNPLSVGGGRMAATSASAHATDRRRGACHERP
eukprot:9504055-Pyramimonas_sp.AAC.1